MAAQFTLGKDKEDNFLLLLEKQITAKTGLVSILLEKPWDIFSDVLYDIAFSLEVQRRSSQKRAE